MERKDLEGLVRKVVSQVMERLEAAPAPVLAPRRLEAEPLSPPPREDSGHAAQEGASGASPRGSAGGAGAASSAQDVGGAATSAASKPAPLSKNLTVAIGSDHGGFKLKESLVPRLHALGYAVIDVGTHDTEPVDYPDFAKAVAFRVARGEVDRGVVIDGAGIGSGMAANKVRGVRCGVCHDVKTVLNSREHNDANVLSIGSGVVSPELAAEMVEIWLKTPFGGGRHSRRVAKIKELDQDQGRPA